MWALFLKRASFAYSATIRRSSTVRILENVMSAKTRNGTFVDVESLCMSVKVFNSSSKLVQSSATESDGFVSTLTVPLIC